MSNDVTPMQEGHNSITNEGVETRPSLPYTTLQPSLQDLKLLIILRVQAVILQIHT